MAFGWFSFLFVTSKEPFSLFSAHVIFELHQRFFSARRQSSNQEEEGEIVAAASVLGRRRANDYFQDTCCSDLTFDFPNRVKSHIAREVVLSYMS